jgi:hypothetical protein
MAEIVGPHVLAEKQRYVALVAERKEWGARRGLGYANDWDWRAIALIEAEQKRIEAELNALRKAWII